MSARLEITMPPDEPVITFRRFVGAPPALVFEVWTEPEHLRHWRGPHEVELVTCVVDLRLGGQYRYVHRAPDGREHAFHGEYQEVEPPHRLVSTFVYEDAPEDVSVETVTFEAVEGGTIVVGRSVLPSFAAREQYINAGAARGLTESHERLDALLEALQESVQVDEEQR